MRKHIITFTLAILILLTLTTCATFQAELTTFAQWAVTHRGNLSWSTAWRQYAIWRLANGHSAPLPEVEIPPMLHDPGLESLLPPTVDQIELRQLLVTLQSQQ